MAVTTPCISFIGLDPEGRDVPARSLVQTDGLRRMDRGFLQPCDGVEPSPKGGREAAVAMGPSLNAHRLLEIGR
jgi:hypothetical protein